ncbi:hypothetical protein CSC07_3690 [Escherichia coli]|nr:hypothetical protein CSC07_3690 [Escherichia coli]
MLSVLARNIITALRSCQRRRTTPVVRVAIKQFLEKELMPWTARRCSREA